MESSAQPQLGDVLSTSQFEEGPKPMGVAFRSAGGKINKVHSAVQCINSAVIKSKK